jgi:hypothetical protein
MGMIMIMEMLPISVDTFLSDEYMLDDLQDELCTTRRNLPRCRLLLSIHTVRV